MICFQLHMLQHLEKLLIMFNKIHSSSANCKQLSSFGFQSQVGFVTLDIYEERK